MVSKKVFDGIKIAEFAWAAVGPLTSKYLAEHGATVVRIESHKRVDILRSTSPVVGKKPGADNSMCYGRHNSNKYSVSIDLEHPRGRELAWKLIEWADIMTESFSPRVMKKWGLDYDSVVEVKPDIIYLSSSMQGRGGPHSNYAGYGHNAAALCGFSEISGWPDLAPAAPYGPYTDFVCPRFNATALIAALEFRRRTGKGQWIEQSQFETSLHFTAPMIMDFMVNERITSRQGNSLSNAAPHGLFPCQGDDRWVAIAVFTELEWLNFCTAIGNPGLAQKATFANLEQRKKNEKELESIVGKWTSKYTAQQVENILQSAGIVANIVSKPSDIYEDLQLKHRNYFTPLNHPVMGKQAFEPQSCFMLSKTPREVTMPSPCLGEHNLYVFKELLGMTDDEIADHIVDGSITTELAADFHISM